MIVAQGRGQEFHRIDDDGWKWTMTYGPPSPPSILNDMAASLDIADYLDVLTTEGEAFRQRFVDYTPPKEAP